MGGHAFASGPNPLYTPRMSPIVYHHIKCLLHGCLRELFLCVATPIEGPGKEDFGDIDILVAMEKRLEFPQTPQDQEVRGAREVLTEVKNFLGAVAIIFDPGTAAANMAIPWPESLAHCDLAGQETAADGRDSHRYIQVDIRICSDVQDLQWRLFAHAHGDIWNLLRYTIRPFGLTVDDQAMWLRIPEIEQLDRKKAKVFLTRDSIQILRFLGMEVGVFWEEPFGSVDALFNYVATCRLFLVGNPNRENEASGDENTPSTSQAAGVEGGERGRKKLKADDRKRIMSRPVFRRWIDEFIPKCTAEGCNVASALRVTVEQMRNEVRAEAFRRFAVEPEYNARLTEWQRVRHIDMVWRSVIKAGVPADLDPSFQGCLASALKKIILENDVSFGFTPSVPLRDSAGFYNIDATREFIERIHGALGPVAWARQQQRARNIKEQKELKRKALCDSDSSLGLPK
ncbi:hypothetical protein GQ53DRAFT_217193 [Thozetella sp. PMI_491]|nr:hypothetical protein GQ53DRAFT_217193 [Thozetella sp. PMI_491]